MKNYITVHNHLVRGVIYKEKDYENVFLVKTEAGKIEVIPRKYKQRIDRNKRLRDATLMAKIKVHYPDGTFTIFDNAHEAGKAFDMTAQNIYYNTRLNRVMQKGKSKGLRFEKMR